MAQLDRILAQIFPDPGGVVVQDKVLGFRPGEKRRVVRVEVFGGGQAGTSVVTIGPVGALGTKNDDWRSSRPGGLGSDVVDVRRVVGALRPNGFMDTGVSFFGKNLPAEQKAASEA
jgi:hypothetical protein